MQPVTYEDLTIRPYEHGSSDDQKGYILRHKVLALSPAVSDGTLDFIFKSHDDEVDYIKIGAFTEEGMVGTLCLVPQAGDAAMIKQFAVSQKLQGTGIGRKLLEYAHDAARELGYKRVVLDARENVVGFYAKAGYILAGEKRVGTKITLVPMYIDL